MADTYDVITQVPTTRYDEGTGFQEVVKVVYRTKPEGITGTIYVPRTQYADTAAVQAAIESDVAAHKAVRNL